MTALTERPTTAYNKNISTVLIMIGLVVLGLNLEFYVRALELSSSLIPNAPNVHLFAPQGVAALFAVGSQTFDLQPILGMLMALLLFLFGPALLITVLLKNSQEHSVVLGTASLPLLFLYSVDIDWLFIQFLHLDGLPWLIATSIFSVLAVKAVLSLTTVFSDKKVNGANEVALYLSAFTAPVVLLLLKTFLVLSFS